MAEPWTPGPWVADEYAFEVGTPENEHGVVCSLEGSHKRRQANARLIVVAPDLAEWLRDYVASDDGYQKMTSGRFGLPRVAEARALLARIRGES